MSELAFCGADTEITCATCGSMFVFSAAERAFYQEKRLAHEPRHCRSCRDQRKVQMAHPSSARHAAQCSDCASPTTVPFVPISGRPVYCPSCYPKHRVPRAQRVVTP